LPRDRSAEDVLGARTRLEGSGSWAQGAPQHLGVSVSCRKGQERGNAPPARPSTMGCGRILQPGRRPRRTRLRRSQRLHLARVGRSWRGRSLVRTEDLVVADSLPVPSSARRPISRTRSGLRMRVYEAIKLGLGDYARKNAHRRRLRAVWRYRTRRSWPRSRPTHSVRPTSTAVLMPRPVLFARQRRRLAGARADAGIQTVSWGGGALPVVPRHAATGARGPRA